MATQDDSSKQVNTDPSQASARWTRGKWVIVLVLLSLPAILISFWQVSKTRSLRQIALSIQPGRPLSEVHELLGGAAYGYSAPGGNPEQFGAMYVGPVNSGRETLESVVRSYFPRLSGWYSNEWPVVIQYDSNDIVTGVLVDGVKVTPSE